MREIRGSNSIRRAAVTLEMIVALPVLTIALLVVIELGVVMANLKHVAAASREGARLAAERCDEDDEWARANALARRLARG